MEARLDELRLPCGIAEVYRRHCTTANELYAAAVTFRALDAIARDARREGPCFGMRYTGRDPLCYVYDRLDDTVCSVLGGRVVAQTSVAAFLSAARAQLLAQEAQDDLAYRHKCVNGVYVPSPALAASSNSDDEP